MGTPIAGDEDEDVGAVAPTGRVPYHEQSTSQKWEQLKAHTFIVFNDPDDGVDYLSVGEVLEVEHRGSDEETFIVWCLVHRHSLSNSYKHNMPLVQQRLSPEYVDGRGRSWINPTKKQLKDLQMSRLQYGHNDCEIIVPSFTLETGGKVPKRVCEHVDKHLRKKVRQGHTGCLPCLNFPTPAELTKIR